MAATGIEQRVQLYLQRQIDWLNSTHDALECFEQRLNATGGQPPDEDELPDAEELGRQLHHFSREQQGLLREWRTADRPADVQEAVRRHAATAADLTDALLERYESLLKKMDAVLLRRDAETGELRKGRDMVNRYRSEADAIPRYLDRQS